MSGSVVFLVISLVVGWLWQRGPLESTPEETVTNAGSPLTAIAVLPFDDLSPDADHGWLGEGLADDLIDALSRIENLHVPARYSTAIVKESGADLATIGERLEVVTVVEGSVRRAGDELSVLARWIRIDDGKRLWFARFDRQFDDVLEIQKEITVGIAEAIRTELGIQDAPADLLDQRYATSDVRAWEMLKKAVPLMSTNEPANIAEARTLLLMAEDYDPGFTAVQESLAYVEYFDDLDRGIERYKSILAQDPSNPNALAALAFDSSTRFWDFQTAEQLLQRIPDVRKTSTSLESESWVLSNIGRPDAARRAAKMAARLDPMNARAHCMLGNLLVARGDFNSAFRTFQKSLAAFEASGQSFGDCAGNYLELHLRLGRDSQIVPRMFDAFGPNAEMIMQSWQSGGVEEMYLTLADLSEREGWCNYTALAHAGAIERMYNCLEYLIDRTDIGDPVTGVVELGSRNYLIMSVRWMDDLAHYREQPRFQALTRRVDERMSKAAGTYPSKVGLELTP